MNSSTVDTDSAAADDSAPLAAAPAQAAVHLPAPSFEDDLPLTPLPSSPHTLGPGPGGGDAPFPCAPDQTIRPSDACAVIDDRKDDASMHNNHDGDNSANDNVSAAPHVAPLDDPDAVEVDTNHNAGNAHGSDNDEDEDAPLLLAEFKEDASATVSPALVGTAAPGRAAHPLDNEHDDDDDAGQMATSHFSGRLRGCAQFNDHDEPERSTSLSMMRPHATWETASVESCGASRADFTDANHSHSNPGIYGGGSAFGGLGFGGSVSGTCREETASVALDAGLEEGYEWALEMFDPAFFTGTAVAGRRSGAAGRLSMLGLSSSRTPTQGGMGAGGLARPGSAALVPLTPPMSFARVGEPSVPSLSLLGPHHQPTSSSSTAPSIAGAGHAERRLHQPPTLEAADALPAPAMPLSSDVDNAVKDGSSSSGAFMLPEPRMAQRATASGPSSPASKRRSLERTRTARPSEFPAPLAAVSRQGTASFSGMRKHANNCGGSGSGGMMRGSQSNSFEEGDDEDQPIFFVEELQLVEMDREKGLTSPSTPPQLAETPKVAPAKSALLASGNGTSPPSWPAEHPRVTTQGENPVPKNAKHPHRTRTSPASPIEEKPGQYVIVGPEVRRRALPPPSPTRVVPAQLSSNVASSTEGKGKRGLLPSVHDSSSIPMAMSRAPLPHQVDITSSTLSKPPAAKTTKNKRERDLGAKAGTGCGVGSMQEHFTLPVSALSASTDTVLAGSVAERVHRRRHTKPDPAETVIGVDKKNRRVTRKREVTTPHHQSSNDNDDAHHDDAGTIAESTAAALAQGDSPYRESQVMTKSDSCGWVKSKLKRARSDPGGPNDGVARGHAASRVSHRLSRKDVSHPAFHWSRFSDSEETEASDSDDGHAGASSIRHPPHETGAAVVASSRTHESRGMMKCERRQKFTTPLSVHRRPKNAPFAPVLCRFFSLPAPCDFPRTPFSGGAVNAQRGPPGEHHASTPSIAHGGDGGDGDGGGGEKVSEFAPIEFMKGDAKRRKKVLEERKKAHLLAVQRAMALHTATCEETWDPVDNRCGARPAPLAAVTSSKQIVSTAGESVPSDSRPAPQQTLSMPQQALAGLTSPPLKEVRNFSELLAHLKQEKEEKASGCTPKVSPRLAPARPLLPLASNPLSDAMSPFPPIRSEKSAAVANSSDSKQRGSQALAVGGSEPQQPRVSFVNEEASAGGHVHATSAGAAAPAHLAHHHHSRPTDPKHHPQHQHHQQHHRRAVDQQQHQHVTLASVFPLVVCADVHQQALPVLHRPTPVRPRGLSRGADTEESHHRADVHHAFRRVDAAASRQTECKQLSQLKHLKPPVSGPGSQHCTTDGRVKSEGSTKSAASKRVQSKSKVASPAGPAAPPPGTPSSATVESRPPVVSPAIVDRGAFPSAHGSSSAKMPGDGAVADAASQIKAPSERVKSQGRVGVLSPAGFAGQSPGGGSVVSSPTAALFDESDFGLPRRRRKRDRGRCADDSQLQPQPQPPLDDAPLSAVGPKEKPEVAEKETEKAKEKQKAKKEKKKKHRFHGDSKLKAGPFLLNP